MSTCNILPHTACAILHAHMHMDKPLPALMQKLSSVHHSVFLGAVFITTTGPAA